MAAKFDLTDDRSSSSSAPARAAARSRTSWPEGVKVVLLEAGKRHEIAGLRQRRMGEPSASWPGWTCARRPARGASPDFPNCRPGSQGRRRHDDALGGRVAAFPRARVQGAHLVRRHRRREPDGLADHARGSRARTTPAPRTRWASPAPTASRGCRATTTSRSCTRRDKVGYKTATPGTWQSTAAARGSRLCSSSASAFRAASPAPNGRRCTPRFRRRGDRQT